MTLIGRTLDNFWVFLDLGTQNKEGGWNPFARQNVEQLRRCSRSGAVVKGERNALFFSTIDGFGALKLIVPGGFGVCTCEICALRVHGFSMAAAAGEGNFAFHRLSWVRELAIHLHDPSGGRLRGNALAMCSALVLTTSSAVI